MEVADAAPHSSIMEHNHGILSHDVCFPGHTLELSSSCTGVRAR